MTDGAPDMLTIGTRVEVECCSHLGHEVAPGSRGTVASVLHAPSGQTAVTIRLDDHETRTLIYPLDRFRIVPPSS